MNILSDLCNWILWIFLKVRFIACLTARSGAQEQWRRLVTGRNYYQTVQLRDRNKWEAEAVISRIPAQCHKVVKRPLKRQGLKVTRAISNDQVSLMKFLAKRKHFVWLMSLLFPLSVRMGNWQWTLMWLFTTNLKLWWEEIGWCHQFLRTSLHTQH